jgi:hypothetical protein
MGGNLIDQQNALVNVVPLPVADSSRGIDPNDTVPIGDGESVMPDDDESWMRGGMMRIGSQAEFDALPEERKEVIRAAMAMGGQLKLDDAVAIYREARKARAEAVPVEVTLPDGKTVYKVGNQVIDPVETRKRELELQTRMAEREKAAVEERDRQNSLQERRDFVDRLKEYRGWVKSGGVVGPGADIRQKVDAWANPESYKRRWKLNQVVGEQVLGNIRKLGANPTEGERKFLMDMQPKITDPAGVWDDYFDTLENIMGRQVDGPAIAKDERPQLSSTWNLVPGNKQSISTAGPGGAAAGVASSNSAAAGPAYKSPAEVKAAFKAGRISRDEAIRVINGMGVR